MRFSSQCRKIFETCSVVLGRNTQGVAPRYSRSQQARPARSVLATLDARDAAMHRAVISEARFFCYWYRTIWRSS